MEPPNIVERNNYNCSVYTKIKCREKSIGTLEEREIEACINNRWKYVEEASCKLVKRYKVEGVYNSWSI